jgi:hypothetical protein
VDKIDYSSDKIRIEAIDYFQKAHEIFKLSDSLKWNDRITKEFVDIFKKTITLNFGTNKLYAVFGKFLTEKPELFKIRDMQTQEFIGWKSEFWRGIQALSIGGIVHGDTITALSD